MSVEALIQELKGANLVQLPELKKKIISLGPETIPALLEAVPKGVPAVESLIVSIFQMIKDSNAQRQAEVYLEGYLNRRYEEAIRSTAIGVIGALRYKNHISSLHAIAMDSIEPPILQKQALQALSQMPLVTGDVDRILEPIRNHQNHRDDIILLAMDIVETYENTVTLPLAQKALENLLTSEHTHLRCRAIELLGTFGDLDVMERVCMLPKLSVDELTAVHRLVDRIMARPRNLVALRPEHFELVIKRLIEKLGYKEVNMTKMTWDGGVDLTAMRDGGGLARGRIDSCIIQCKRYQPGTHVDATTFKKLQEALREHKAALGVIITTAGFTADTLELAKDFKPIELIGGEALQDLLDKTYGEGVFCIKPTIQRATIGAKL